VRPAAGGGRCGRATKAAAPLWARMADVPSAASWNSITSSPSPLGARRLPVTFSYAPGAEIETTRVELGERGDQVGGDVALPFSQRADAGKECGIRQGAGEREWRRHTSGIPWPFLPLEKARRPDIQRVTSRRPIRGGVRPARRILASLRCLRGGVSPSVRERCKNLSSVFLGADRRHA
jgi:hypothetical protein